LGRQEGAIDGPREPLAVIWRFSFQRSRNRGGGRIVRGFLGDGRQRVRELPRSRPGRRGLLRDLPPRVWGRQVRHAARPPHSQSGCSHRKLQFVPHGLGPRQSPDHVEHRRRRRRARVRGLPRPGLRAEHRSQLQWIPDFGHAEEQRLRTATAPSVLRRLSHELPRGRPDAVSRKRALSDGAAAGLRPALLRPRRRRPGRRGGRSVLERGLGQRCRCDGPRQ
jgi:hypothetical protein